VREFAEFTGILLILVLALVVTTMGIGAGLTKLAALSYPVRVETVRDAVNRLGCTASEDVIGTAAGINREIASAKYWNAVPVLSLLAPDEIVTAVPIDLPRCAQ
jgi:hypothetical protein